MDSPSKKRKPEADTIDAVGGPENSQQRKKKRRSSLPPFPTDSNEDTKHENDDTDLLDCATEESQGSIDDTWNTSDLLDDMLNEPCFPLVPPRSILSPATTDNNNPAELGNDEPSEQGAKSPLDVEDYGTPVWSPLNPPAAPASPLMLDTIMPSLQEHPASPQQTTTAVQVTDTILARPITEGSPQLPIILDMDSPEGEEEQDHVIPGCHDEDDLQTAIGSQSQPPPPSLDSSPPMGTQTQSLQQSRSLKPWTKAMEEGLHRLKSSPTDQQQRGITMQRRRLPLDTDALDPDSCYEQKLKLWWFDAHQHHRKGIVYLFGKILDRPTNQYVSCCVLVKNIQRTIYVLPRQYRMKDDDDAETTEVTMDDVKDEISQVLKQNTIYSWKCTVRSRKYAFGLDEVPVETNYLKIQYSFEDPELPGHINGYTFSHVFGTNNTPMEQFLIKRGIKGPQWLELTGVQLTKAPMQETWCQYEWTVTSPKHVNLLEASNQPPAPPLSVMSLHLSTSTNPKSFSNEIVAAGVLYCPKVMLEKIEDLDSLENARFAVIRPWEATTERFSALDEALERSKQDGLIIRIEDSEYGLLNYLCAKIHRYDPDVIVGHGFSRFTLDVLLHRMKVCKTSFWHKIGRLRWKDMPKLQPGPSGTSISSTREKSLLVGRIVCDTMTACRTLIVTKSYNLSSLAETQLGIQREDDLLKTRPSEHTFGDPEATVRLARHCWMDAYLAMMLLFKFQVLPLSKKLTNIAGNLWSRSMDGSRMNRNEYLLLHEFHRLKYICPDKILSDYEGIELMGLEDEKDPASFVTPAYHFGNKQAKKKGSSYGGGLLLEPKIGLYERFVVLLDFNSLYPSIIQEFNICFTTVDAKKIGDDTLLPDVPGPTVPLGVLPRLMKRFVDERKQVKQQMKTPGLDENKRMQYDIEQNALKLTANSLYGSLGSGFSRFSAKHLAAMITSQGRSILRDTVDSVEHQLNMDVVYGDTDSIMVATNESTLEAAQQIARQVQQVINGRYQLLELGIDGYFRRLLILGKKNYASLTMVKLDDGLWDQVIKPKGSSVIRKDVSELSLFTTMRVLKVILSDEPNKQEAIHDVLKRIDRQVRAGDVPLTKFLIHKQLTKDLDDYTSAKGQTHVQVAMRMQKAGHIIKGGDTVAYVVCKTDDEALATMADKALPLSEAEIGEKVLDYEWYYQHELLPSVTRLCEPIMNTSDLPVCFGLPPDSRDTSSESRRRQRTSRSSASSSTASFKTLDRTTLTSPFKAHCPHCTNLTEMKGYARYNDNEGWVCGMQCHTCRQIIPVASLSSQWSRAIRYYIHLYYQGWLICQEPDCDYRTRDCILQCQSSAECHGMLAREYTNEMLYAQLVYFNGLFDTKKDTNDPHLDPGKRILLEKYGQAFGHLHRISKRYLDQCSYRFIDIGAYTGAYDASE